MTAEEYIENIVSAHSDMRWMDASELRAILTSVMDMARKEEREKAIEALDIAIMTVFEKYNHSVSIEKLIDQFDKFLNE